MSYISALIKPSSANCNMRCKYCFYHNEAKSRSVYSYGFMSEQTARMTALRLFENCDKGCNIAFQGGEPMLIGLEFFKTFIGFVNEYNTKKVPVSYSIQTNGTLIDENWCKFFKENNFLVGVSLDGDRETHDYLRCVNGNGAYKTVISGIELLKKHGIEFNILVVVTKYIARHYERVYKNLKKCGFKFLQFIPCLDDFDMKKSEYSLTDTSYGDFLVGIYRLWLVDYNRGEYISIRLFDNMINKANGNGAEMCGLNGVCSVQNVVEADGSVYPCDFYCLDKMRLGNVYEHSFEDMRIKNTAKNFIEESLKIHDDCAVCKYYALCQNGCRRERLNGKNIFCESYKRLYGEMFNG